MEISQNSSVLLDFCLNVPCLILILLQIDERKKGEMIKKRSQKNRLYKKNTFYCHIFIKFNVFFATVCLDFGDI